MEYHPIFNFARKYVKVLKCAQVRALSAAGGQEPAEGEDGPASGVPLPADGQATTGAQFFSKVKSDNPELPPPPEPLELRPPTVAGKE